MSSVSAIFSLPNIFTLIVHKPPVQSQWRHLCLVGFFPALGLRVVSSSKKLLHAIPTKDTSGMKSSKAWYCKNLNLFWLTVVSTFQHLFNVFGSKIEILVNWASWHIFSLMSAGMTFINISSPRRTWPRYSNFFLFWFFLSQMNDIQIFLSVHYLILRPWWLVCLFICHELFLLHKSDYFNICQT